MGNLKNIKVLINKLAQVDCFSKLDEPALYEMAQALEIREYAAGERVFWEGEANVGLCIVGSGWLKAVRLSIEGREQVIRFLKPGEVFNEVGLYSEGINLVTVESLEKSEVWVIPPDKYFALIENEKRLCDAMLTHMASRVVHMLSLVEDLSFRSVESRLARALIAHAEEHVAERKHWSTQAEMAAHMGTVPDVLNRALRNLAGQNLIRVERSRITILDEEGLKKVALLAE